MTRLFSMILLGGLLLQMAHSQKFQYSKGWMPGGKRHAESAVSFPFAHTGNFIQLPLKDTVSTSYRASQRQEQRNDGPRRNMIAAKSLYMN